ncbi:MAG: EipA family protein, partial [Gammaproteobacteria bacterium]
TFKDTTMKQLTLIFSLIALFLSGCASSGTTPGTEVDETVEVDENVETGETVETVEVDETTFSEDEIFAEIEGFFGRGAEGIADVLNKVFSEQGRPNGYIKGDEAGGAFTIGLRYGRGRLQLKDGTQRNVYWSGPSIGLDIGGNAAKAFVLIYDLPDEQSLYQRFPGVDGSLYFVGGVGVNYNQAGGIRLAPIRFGVGWRQGINIGYMRISEKQTWNPF